ncbi:MAG: hypothetical protein ACRES7_10120 [Gammaproteobacteria bacterium]
MRRSTDSGSLHSYTDFAIRFLPIKSQGRADSCAPGGGEYNKAKAALELEKAWEKADNHAAAPLPPSVNRRCGNADQSTETIRNPIKMR